MKKALLSLLLFPTVVIAQDAKGTCSAIKQKHFQAKSNTLTVAQIAETERYDVHYYFLDLAMDNLSTDVAGSSEMRATARVQMDSALLEFFPTFTIDSILVNGNNVGYSWQNTALKVPVNANQNDHFSVKVFYNGTPPTAVSNPLGGAGMSNDFSPSWGNQVTWSLSQPFSAYEWFPVKQSLRDKADSSAFFITVPSTCKAGSNGVLQQVVDLGNGTQRFEWKHNHPIDYYLISVAVAEYVEYNVIANPSNSGPVTIQNFIYNNPQTLPNFQSDIDETADFIELFADMFGPYPFADEKYGHCMAPIGGGMEHQTMTTQGFFNPTLTAHELGHQWWGDHITCASWADIWVNEGFASYCEYLMLEELYAGQQVNDMLDRHDNIMSLPTGSVWVEDSLNETRIFSGRLTYDKGAAIIHTLRFLINNDSLFFAGLRQYQIEYADSTALGVDFIQEMEDVTGMDFTNFMQEWYFGEGFPTYSVRWNMVGTDLLVELSQTTSANLITPYFTNDLEIRFDRSGMADTTMRFSVNGPVNQFLIPNAGNVQNVFSIDPSNWIINQNGTITHDVNFLAGISEGAASNELSIFPNPTNGPFTIKMTTEGTYNLTVIDTKGKVLLAREFTNETMVDLQNVAHGAYLIQVSNDRTGAKTRRIVKR